MSTSGKLLELTPGKDNLKPIIDLDERHFPLPWNQDEWLAMDPRHYLLYAWQKTDIEAFALFHRVGDDQTAHLLKISVLPELRGTGLTTRFWGELISKLKLIEVKSIYLEVEKTNFRAVKFYQKMGFLPLREIKAYYSDGTAALTMSLTL
jgi:ribosomal-protein-alanine N-acetyltransferase